MGEEGEEAAKRKNKGEKEAKNGAQKKRGGRGGTQKGVRHLFFRSLRNDNKISRQ